MPREYLAGDLSAACLVSLSSQAVYFFSTFFASVWLSLYSVSVPLSRVLIRMNNGVGFLLRVTDVERQPFRSMRFVSVIIVSWSVRAWAAVGVAVASRLSKNPTTPS